MSVEASGPDPRLIDAVRSRLVREGAEASPARVAAALRAEGNVLGDSEVLSISRLLRADLAGAGPLDPLLADPDVTDILVNGPDDVWIEDSGGLRRTDIHFPDDSAVRRLAQRLASQAGRRLDTAAPWIDARLPSGDLSKTQQASGRKGTPPGSHRVPRNPRKELL